MLLDYSDPFISGHARFDFDNNKFLQGRLSLLSGLRALAIRRRAWFQRSGQGVAMANNDLRQMVADLRVRGISPFVGQVGPVLEYDVSNDDLVAWCEAQALLCERVINRFDDAWAGLRVVAFLDSLGIDPAGLFSKRNRAGEIVEREWRARVCCAQWWRRKVRVVCARGAEAVCRNAGYTARRTGVYVSDFTFTRWCESQRRNKSVIDSQDLINVNTGESLPLSLAVEASVSNPVNRRGELMTRARGFEEVAEGLGYIPMFFTVTCPSRFHAWSGDRRNPKFDGSSPRDAAEYLSRLWAGARARLARLDVAYFGFRVAEPHHDGCPHWHLLLFVDPAHKWPLVEVLAGHALEDSPDEPGAAAHRFEAVQIEADSGSGSGATGYIAKYIAKNIDGFAVGDDLESLKSADVSALRVRAWASVWGIRQFQQVGGPGVTIWRELRRIANDALETVGGPVFQAALEAADAGDWCGYVNAMGGAVLARQDRPLSLCYSAIVAGVERLGRYGDEVLRVVGVAGDRAGGAAGVALSRVKAWLVRRRDSVAKSFSTGVAAAGKALNGFAGPPVLYLDSCQ